MNNTKNYLFIELCCLAILCALIPLPTSAFQHQFAEATISENDAPAKVLMYGVPVEFVEELKQRTFTYFWEVVDAETWQSDDRYPTRNFTSVAATGFALPSYIIGVHNGYVNRKEGAERVLNTMEWLWNAPQGSGSTGFTGHKGFFYHFLNYGTGDRFKQVELSTIDTGLLMAGVLTAQSYFDGNNETEQRIRTLADSLYLRVDWNWAMNNNKTMSMGWHPERGFIKAQWTGYNEAMVLLIQALGSPTHPIPENSWEVWTETYLWEDFYGFEHVNFGPLFGHQYSQMFVDFRGIQDAYMKEKGIDYFENSRRATLSNRAYAIANPANFEGYSDQIWGLTASDGPANVVKEINGKEVRFKTYTARGASSEYINDDGTIVPTAAGGSIPFAPEETLGALYAMKTQFGEKLYTEYGFLDAFNLTFEEGGWFNKDYIGIDQGPILIQIENLQTGLIWETLKKNKYIQSGLIKAGFTGGWMEEIDGIKTN